MFKGLDSDAAYKLAKNLGVANKEVVDFVRTSKGGLKEYEAAMQSASKSTSNFQKGLSPLKNIGGTLLSTFTNMAVAMAASWAVGKIIEGIDNYIHRVEIAIEKGEEAREKLSGIYEEYDSASSVVNGSGERFGALREGVNVKTNENISLTNEEYSEYLSLCNQIADVYPQLVTSYDAQGNAILNLGTDAETATEQLDALLEKQQQVAYNDAKEEIGTALTGSMASIGEYKKQLKGLEEDIASTDEVINLSTKQNNILAQLKSLYDTQRLEFTDATQDVVMNTVMPHLVEHGIDFAGNRATQYDDNGNIIGYYEDLTGFPATQEEWDAIIDEIGKNLELEFPDVSNSSGFDKVQLLGEKSGIEFQIQSEWDTIVSDIQKFVKNEANYNELSTEMQELIQQSIANTDMSMFPELSEDEYAEYIENTYIRPISDLYNSQSTEAHIVKAKTALANLYNLGENVGTLNVNEYDEQLNAQLSVLEEYWKTIKGEEEGEEFYKEFVLRLGFKVEDEDGNLVDTNDTLIENIKEKATLKGEDVSDIDFESLTVEQLVAIEAKVTDSSYGDTVSQAVEDETKKVQESINSSEITFSSILSSEDVTKQVDDFQSNISSVKEALDALRSGDYDPSFITDLKQQFPSLSESLNTVGTNAKMQSDILSSACEDIEYYKNELRSALDLKIDLSKTIFGNVNTDDRQILQWTEDNLNVYKDALMSWADDSLTWDDVKSSLENSISTVFGGSSSYEIDGQEVEIAYTPILQTKEGAKLLDAHTVSEYIYGLIDKATEDGNWSKEELLSLDVEGLEFNGIQIQGLLADIGDTAIQTGEAMHYVGKNGSIASAYSNIAEKAKEVGMSVNEFIQTSEQVSQHGEYINNLKSMLNGLAVDNFVSTMKSIKTAMEGVTDPTQLAAMKSFGEDLKKQFISALDMSDVTADDLLNNFKEVTSLDNWNPTAFQNSFGKLVSEFGGTEEGRAGLITLAAAIELDPSLAYADYETLKAYVEDNKFIADIEFSQNRIEELQSQMTALQDEATKVQYSLSLKEENGVKPLVNDYQKLIKNSNQQVKNLQNQNAELRNQQTALKSLGLDETSAAYQEIESQINANVSAINQARLSQVEWNKTVDSLRYEPNEGLMAYNTAKSTRNAGDNYLDMLAAAKEAQEARQKGLIGTDDFKTVAEMFSPNGMDDATNWDENYGNITRYFTEDVTGVKNALNDLEDANLATQDSMGNWTYSIDDVQKSADTLGVSFEAFLAIMGRLQDYGFSNDFFSSIEEGQEHISDLYTELTNAELEMQRLKKARDDGDTSVTDSVLASQEARVNQIKQSILESQDLLAQLASKDAQTYQAEQNAKIQSVLTMAKTSRQLDEQYVQGYLSNIQDTIEENGLEVDLKDLITINDDGSLAINWEEYFRLENQVGIPLEVTTEFKDAQVEEIKTKLTSAMEDGTSEVQSFVDTIAQYSSEQLGSITFGDGSYGEFEDAERAIDGLLSSLGLSQSEAQTLLTILAEMGKIEYTPEVSTEGVVEETQGAISEAQSTAAENPVVIPTEIETSGETTTVEGGTATVNIEGNNEGAKQSATEAKEFGDSQSANINVGADTSEAYSDVNKLIDNVNNRFAYINVGANTFGLMTDIDNALSRTITLNVHANVTVSTASGGVALGTAHANGTVLDMWNNYRASIGAYAKGNNWALPRNETALVNELGKFMLSINLFNCWKLLRVL